MKAQSIDSEREILRYLLDGNFLSITDLSKASGISVPTVTKYLSALVRKGLVESCGKVSTEHGRKPSLYRICPGGGYFVGVDIRPRAVIMSIMDISGRFILSKEVPMAFASTPETLEAICSEVETMIGEAPVPKEQVRRLTFNISGRVNPKTGFSYTMFN